jgi:hypothetical protein
MMSSANRWIVLGYEVRAFSTSLELRLREALGEALPHRNWEKAIIATQAIGTGCGSTRRVW